MKAIILNSGVGKRLYPLTKNNPKCLTRINGNTILGHQLENILHFGIDRFIITTGPFEGKIKNFIKVKFPHLNVEYIKNNKYKTSNIIYSVWLTKGLIDDDIIIMHGDLVFDKNLLGKILNEKYYNCALIDNIVVPPKKDFKVLIQDGIIKKIGVNVFDENAYFLAPLYKFSKDSFNLWLNEIEKYVEKGEINIYAEEALNNLTDSVKIHPIYYHKEFCSEIDTIEDLQNVLLHLKND